MLWVSLALLAYLLWAFENVIAKYFVNRRFSNPYVFIFIFAIAGSIGLVGLFFYDFKMPDVYSLLWILIASCLYFLGTLPFIKAMQMEEVSRVNLLWNLIPVLSLVFGFFIGDSLSVKEMTAFFLLLSGAIISSLHKEEKAFKFSKAFWLMLLSCLFYSLYAIFSRYASRSVPFFTIFFFIIFFDAIFSAISLLGIKKFRIEFFHEIKKTNYKDWLLMLLIVIFANAAIFLNQWALSKKSAAIFSSLEGFQIIFVFIIAYIFHKFNPDLLDESFERKNFILKFIAFVLMVAGVLLISA